MTEVIPDLRFASSSTTAASELVESSALDTTSSVAGHMLPILSQLLASMSEVPQRKGVIALPPPEHLLPVLTQLLTGVTDVTASQRLGMSPRTFSRRVSELLEHLSVQSRFQAGVASAWRGWVVPARPPGPSR